MAFKYLNDATVGAGAITSNVLPLPQNVAPGTWAYDSLVGPIWNNGSSWVPLSNNSGTTNIFLSAWPGIDPNPANDSRIATSAAMTFVSGTNNTLVVDCPVYIATGIDNTKTTYVPSGTNLDFTAAGAFIYDAAGVPAMAWIGVNNCTWTDYTIRYIGNPGLNQLSYTGQWATNNGNWNTTNLTNQLKTLGCTFSGGAGATAIWPGRSNTAGLHYIGGDSYNINFIGSCSVTAVNSTADRFLPVLFTLAYQWRAGQAVVASGGNLVTPINSTTAAQPSNISFDGWMVDGIYMGWVGTGANVKMKNITRLRYGDLEDALGLYPGGTDPSGRSGHLTNDLWLAPPHLFYLQSSNASFLCSVDYENILDEGIYTTNSALYGFRRARFSGYINSLKLDASGLTTVKNYVCKAPDGFCDVLGNGFASVGCFMDGLDVALDCGVGAYALTATGNISGTSFTITGANWPANNSGGSYTGVSSGSYMTQFSTGEVRLVTYTVTIVGNSATTVAAAFHANTPDALLSTATPNFRMGVNGSFAFRYPAATVQDLYIKNLKIRDSAARPLNHPLLSDATASHVNIFLDADTIVQDYPPDANYVPGFGIAGEGVSIHCRSKYLNCSSVQTLRGPIVNTSTVPTNDHRVEHELEGWRQTNIVFASAPSGTSANLLSACWPLGITGWIYPTGTYNVLFSDNEVKAVSFTKGSVACTWTGALTGAPTVNASVCLINAAQFNLFKPRIQLALTGATPLLNFGVRARVIDVSNGVEIEVNQGLQEERWWQSYQGTPTGATPITYDSTWAIDRASWGVTQALSGGTATNVNLVTGGNTVLSNASVASPAPLPIVGPQPYAGVITVSPVSGSLPNAGTAVISTRGVRTKCADGT